MTPDEYKKVIRESIAKNPRETIKVDLVPEFYTTEDFDFVMQAYRDEIWREAAEEIRRNALRLGPSHEADYGLWVAEKILSGEQTWDEHR